MIEIENRSLRYFFSAAALTDQEPSLTLWLHRSLVEHLRLQEMSDRKTTALISSEIERPFQGSLVPDSQFGFGGALRVGGWSQDFLLLSIPLPACEHEGSTCRICKADPEEVTDCFSCQGSGKEVVHDAKPVWPIVSTLGLLLQMTYSDDSLFGEQAPKAEPPFQILTVEMAADKKNSIFAIHGVYSIPLIAWLARFPQSTSFKPLIDAMQRVSDHIFPLATKDPQSMQATAGQDGWLNISCRGEGCILHPSHHGIRHGRGVEFFSHNIDYPAQLLILLSALAALTDLAKQNRVGQ